MTKGHQLFVLVKQELDFLFKNLQSLIVSPKLQNRNLISSASTKALLLRTQNVIPMCGVDIYFSASFIEERSDSR